jgi:hypothetical protein
MFHYIKSCIDNLFGYIVEDNLISLLTLNIETLSNTKIIGTMVHYEYTVIQWRCCVTMVTIVQNCNFCFLRV